MLHKNNVPCKKRHFHVKRLTFYKLHSCKNTAFLQEYICVTENLLFYVKILLCYGLITVKKICFLQKYISVKKLLFYAKILLFYNMYFCKTFSFFTHFYFFGKKEHRAFLFGTFDRPIYHPNVVHCVFWNVFIVRTPKSNCESFVIFLDWHLVGPESSISTLYNCYK